jgi:tetratricopeptide (TPR) repeat protein
MTIGQVQAYIKHGRQAREIDIFERVADGLHIPGNMLGVTRRDWEGCEGAEPGLGITQNYAGRDAPGLFNLVNPSDAGEDFDVLMMIQEADRTDIGPGTIDGLYAMFHKLCQDYPSAGAPELRHKVKRLYSRVMHLRQGRITLSQHRELIAVSAWVAALLSCVEWDMNEREAAETARSATLRFAKEIDHAELRAWSYEMQAWFALTEGRYGDAARIAQAGQEVGGENSAIVQLTMQEARGWARLGQEELAERAINRGYDMLQRLPEADYPRHFIYDRSKFPYYVASCYQWLGQYAKSEEYALQVIKECERNGTTERSPMRMAEIYITLGLVQVHHENLEGAVGSASKALTYDRQTQPHLFIRLAELRHAIVEKFPDAKAAHEFDDMFSRLHGHTSSDQE